MTKVKAFVSRMPMMMTCGEVEAVLLDYAEGQLSPYARFKFELHIKMCRECWDYLAAYRKSMALSSEVLGAADDPAPDDLPEELVDAIMAVRDAEQS